MSRLDSFIRRMEAQRLLIDRVACLAGEVPGPVLELGLGNGRTYHHLRERFPARRVIAFDIKLTAHPDSVPPEGDLVLGDIRETGPRFIGIGGMLAHADLGTGIKERDEGTLRWLPALIDGLLGPGGFAVTGLPMDRPSLLALPLPPGIEVGRYYLYQKT